MIVTFYYLQRKQDRYIFYVGQTMRNASQRLHGHKQDAKRKNSPKDLFIREWANDIEIVPFETVDISAFNKFDTSYREKYWITTFIKYGHPLLNNTLSWMCQYNFKNYWTTTHIVSNDYPRLYQEYEKLIW